MRHALLCAPFIAFIAIAGPSVREIPASGNATTTAPLPTLAYQGRLIQNGVPANGNFSFVFSILDSTGTEQWTSGTQTLAVTDGLYATVLGSDGMPPLSGTVLGISGLMLHITVSGQALAPDVAIIPAFQAQSAWSLLGSFGGDLSGTQNQTMVANLQGFPLDLTTAAPTSGQALVFNGTKWVPSAVAGTAGATGPEGPAGPGGAQGTTGATGPAGAAGAQGTAGPAGAAGALGAQGPAGPTGTAGATGAQGPAGPAGPAGLTGAPGANGAAGTITIGTTTTGAAGSSATVSNSGTANAAILNFTVPQGIAGVTGLFGTNTSQAFGGSSTGSSYHFLGDVWLIAGFVNNGVPCAGQILSIAANAALFDILGVLYGGDGVTTFALPDLRAAAPNGLTYVIATTGIFPSR